MVGSRCTRVCSRGVDPASGRFGEMERARPTIEEEVTAKGSKFQLRRASPDSDQGLRVFSADKTGNINSVSGIKTVAYEDGLANDQRDEKVR